MLTIASLQGDNIKTDNKGYFILHFLQALQ